MQINPRAAIVATGGAAMIVAAITILVGVWWHGYALEIGCLAYMKRAADAPTIDVATDNLEAVLAYADEYQLTTGTTGVLLKRPEYDVGYWYANLVASRDELARAKAEGSSIASSNALMKLRETLTDHGQNGATLVYPSGLEFFPNNTAWFVLQWLAGIGLLVGICLIAVAAIAASA